MKIHIELKFTNKRRKKTPWNYAHSVLRSVCARLKKTQDIGDLTMVVRDNRIGCVASVCAESNFNA